MSPAAQILLFAVMGFAVLVFTGIMIALTVPERRKKTVQRTSAKKTSHKAAHQS